MSDDTTKDVTTREATAMLRTRLLRYKPSRRDGIAADLAMFALSFASPGYRDLLRNAVTLAYGWRLILPHARPRRGAPLSRKTVTHDLPP